MSEKLYYWYSQGGKIPRKLKKKILGSKVKKSVLRKMIKETVVGPPIKTMYEMVEFTPHGAFCPNCGERGCRGTGNLTTYPEHWEYFYCIRCKNKVAVVDNSPFVHILEYKDDNFQTAW